MKTGKLLLAVSVLGAVIALAVTPAPKTIGTAVEQGKLLADNGSTSDQLGVSVAVSGDTVVAGAPNHDVFGSDSGAAYVFVRSGTTWSQQAEIFPDDGAGDDNFGIAVAISGDIIVVGAHENDATCPGTTPLCNAGAAYVFTRSGTNWTQQAKLTPSDPGVADRFGGAVAVDGTTAVVGAGPDDHAGGTDAGSAYVFVQSGTSWNQEAKLIASDASSIDRFGGAVAISGDNIAVGASTASDGASSSGTAYVFVRTTGWAEQAKLSPSDPGAQNLFGDAIDIHGDTVVVGAYRDDDAGVGSGSAYVFQRTGSSWSQQQKLTAGDAQLGDKLGFAVAMDSGVIAAGAFFDDDQGISSGSAYVFAGVTPASVPGVTGWDLMLMGLLFLIVLAWRISRRRQATSPG